MPLGLNETILCLETYELEDEFNVILRPNRPNIEYNPLSYTAVGLIISPH